MPLRWLETLRREANHQPQEQVQQRYERYT
jgi:hypothetical protein